MQNRNLQISIRICRAGNVTVEKLGANKLKTRSASKLQSPKRPCFLPTGRKLKPGFPGDSITKREVSFKIFSKSNPKKEGNKKTNRQLTRDTVTGKRLNATGSGDGSRLTFSLYCCDWYGIFNLSCYWRPYYTKHRDRIRPDNGYRSFFFKEN